MDLQVVDRRSAVPISAVVINVIRDATHLITERTDVHGRVHVDLPQGAYDVMIMAGGYPA
ncbi:MAG: hypothetical protein JO092_05205, partial [Candidatus Eremiobacteraeota bacterium]|nr:hypothetical protein [Candidatus Eremiobacteraeota bacterium]